MFLITVIVLFIHQLPFVLLYHLFVFIKERGSKNFVKSEPSQAGRAKASEVSVIVDRGGGGQFSQL